MKGTNLRTEPKHIVFLSQLLLLFKFCHVCKADNPTVEAGGIGTQAAIKTTCSNPACRKEQTWYSQPLIPGTQMLAGNFLLCLSHKDLPDVFPYGSRMYLSEHIF